MQRDHHFTVYNIALQAYHYIMFMAFIAEIVFRPFWAWVLLFAFRPIKMVNSLSCASNSRFSKILLRSWRPIDKNFLLKISIVEVNSNFAAADIKPEGISNSHLYWLSAFFGIVDFVISYMKTDTRWTLRCLLARPFYPNWKDLGQTTDSNNINEETYFPHYEKQYFYYNLSLGGS